MPHQQMTQLPRAMQMQQRCCEQKQVQLRQLRCQIRASNANAHEKSVVCHLRLFVKRFLWKLRTFVKACQGLTSLYALEAPARLTKENSAADI